jgi:hypothetical protein
MQTSFFLSVQSQNFHNALPLTNVLIHLGFRVPDVSFISLFCVWALNFIFHL